MFRCWFVYIADTPASASITLLFVALFLLVNLDHVIKWKLKSDDHFLILVYGFTKILLEIHGRLLLIGSGTVSLMNMNLSAMGGHDSRFGCFRLWEWKHGNLGPNLLKSIKDKKTKVTLPRVFASDWREHEGGQEHHHEYDLTFGSLHIKAMKMVESHCDQLVAAIQIRKRKMPKPIWKITGFGSSLSGWVERCETKDQVTQHGLPLLAWIKWLNQVAILFSPDSEPSAARLRELTEYIKKKMRSRSFTLRSKLKSETLSSEVSLKSFGKFGRIKKWKMAKTNCYEGVNWRR